MLLLTLDELTRLQAILREADEPELLAQVEDAIGQQHWQEDFLADHDRILQRLLNELKGRGNAD